MSKILLSVAFISLILAINCFKATAQEFRWPRDGAFEIGGGASINSFHFRMGYIHFFQPKKITEIPFKKRFKSLIGQDKYGAFPCKRKPHNKIPPGLSTKVSAFYELGSGKGIKYQIVGADASLLYIIYSTKVLYISLKGGITASNNRLITPIIEGVKTDYYDRFKYGLLGGFEIDRMIGKLQSTSIMAGWEQCYLANSDSWGNKRWYAFIGLRYNIPKY